MENYSIVELEKTATILKKEIQQLRNDIRELEDQIEQDRKKHTFFNKKENGSKNAISNKKIQVVDVCFLIDTSNKGMKKWIDSLKQNFSTFKDQLPKMRSAFITYTDKRDSTKVIPFGAENVERFMLNELKYESSTCNAANVLKSLKSAIELNWNDDGKKVIVHLGNSPNYGKIYQSGKVNGYYPNDDNNVDRAENVMEFLAAANIQYLFCTIDDSTNKMVEIFRHTYERYSKHPMLKIVVADQKQLVEIITASLINTL